MAVPVTMPKLGNTVESSIIVRWLKQPGDQVAEGEPLLEVETDKASMEVESPASGTLLAHFFEPGDDVPVMTTIAAVGSPGDKIDDLRPGGVTISAVSAVEPLAWQPDAQPADLTTVKVEEFTDGHAGISPRARHLAEQKGVDLKMLAGSGPGGRIIERDVQAALAQRPRLTPLAQSMISTGDFVVPSRGVGTGGRITSKDLVPSEVEAPVPQAARADEVETIPVKGIRKVIAERMLASLQTTAQLTLNTSADARALQTYRRKLKTSGDERGLQKITINDLVLFAVSRTLLDYPDLNALFADSAISRYRNVHLGFAVDTPRGLIVPVIRSANQLSLKQLAAEAARLATACQEGKITADELNGGTFTVTNLGNLGIESFTPVLNPPQVAILGVGSIQLKPVEMDDEVQFVPHIGLSLTINHQVVDGAPAARFLQALCSSLAQFDILLAL